MNVSIVTVRGPDAVIPKDGPTNCEERDRVDFSLKRTMPVCMLRVGHRTCVLQRSDGPFANRGILWNSGADVA
jgi:hypothetical protein